MKPVQELFPFVASGCVVEAVERHSPVYIEGQGTVQRPWFTWRASCGAVPRDESRCSHPELAIGQGMRVHVCEPAS